MLPTPYRRRLLAALPVLSCWCAVAVLAPGIARAADAGAAAPPAVQVRVAERGDALVIDADFTVAATPSQCWEVLVDFDNMERFVAGLKDSRVVRRQGRVLHVAQQGTTRYGLLSFDYESLREITLVPQREIRSRGLGGSVRRYQGLTRLIPAGKGTRIVFHAETEPGVAAPASMSAAFARDATAGQLDDLRREILRRGKPVPPR